MRGTSKHTNEAQRHFPVLTSNGLCFKHSYTTSLGYELMGNPILLLYHFARNIYFMSGHFF